MGKFDAQIRQLLSQMTIEEKAGQLHQAGPSLVGAFGMSFGEMLNMLFDGKITQAEFGKMMSESTQDLHEDDLRSGKVGSYNGVSDAKTANRLQKIAVEESRLGIPLIFGLDVIHGFRTVFPIPLAESCAWEPELWEKTARIAAREATAAGVNLTFAPMVDVAKDARWGRISEGAGEDVLMNARFGAAKVQGFQGSDVSRADSLAACAKHFAAYGAAEAGRDYNRVDMSPQRLWEEYLPSYEACVKAGARAVMPAFNDINGVPCTANPELLMDILREKWGFDGITISDANAIAECVLHGIASDRRDASRQALEAGVDIDLNGNCYIESVADLVRSGEVSEEVLDRAVADILRVKFEMGLFDHPYRTDEEKEAATLCQPEFRAAAREAAGKSIVLLKNENKLLPLKKTAKIGVFGSLAEKDGEMAGSWAISAKDEDCVGLKKAMEQEDCTFTYIGDDVSRIGELTDCDCLIAVLGETKDQSGEAASRADISLPKEQLDAFNAMAATGKPVIALLFNGRPLAIPQVAESAAAVVEAWHPGVEAGNAVLDVLFGRVNPSAKLTTTFPFTTGQCPMYYAHIQTGRPGGRAKFTSKYLDTPLTPVYPFGFGLSYTEYSYSDLKVERQENAFTASVKVKNVGGMAGDEIVQCYVRDVVASQRVRPMKQLKDFCKVHLEPGEEKCVRFTVPFDTLGYYDRQMHYIVEPGDFTIFVGGCSEGCLEETVVL